MAGCLIFYVLTDDHIPHETTSTYTNEPEGVVRNMKAGIFQLSHLGRFSSLQPLIERMVSPAAQSRPPIQECIDIFQGNIWLILFIIFCILFTICLFVDTIYVFSLTYYIVCICLNIELFYLFIIITLWGEWGVNAWFSHTCISGFHISSFL